MKITKYGHCCMLIEHNGVKFLTDPGSFNEYPEVMPKLNAILITHEHQDHIHMESLKKILAVQPDALIITNRGVGKLLDVEGIEYQLVEHGQQTDIEGVWVEGFGERHAEIYKGIEPVINTGYFIADYLFYPGDAFVLPGKPVTVLALPVVGPWMRISEALDYALALHPKKYFPVHDGFLKFGGPFYTLPERFLTPAGIEFVPIEINKEVEF